MTDASPAPEPFDAPSFAELAARLAALGPDAVPARRVPALARRIASFGDPAPLRCALLGNVTLDFLAPHATVRAAARGIRLEPHVAPIGQHYQQLLDGALERDAPQAVLLVLDPCELEPDAFRDFLGLSDEARRELRSRVLAHVTDWLALARERLRADLLVASFPTPRFLQAGLADTHLSYGETEFRAELNLELLRALRDDPRAHLFDLDRVLGAVGRNRARDDRLSYLARAPWSEEAHAAVARELALHLGAHLGRARKCLVLDLDNTLWGGVVGEEGPQGVAVGVGDGVAEAYRDLQDRVRAIRRRGILLAICSKNNEEDVREVFAMRPEMPLRLEDFAATEIGWEPKHLGLQRIAQRLNIGIDSIVFVDDNPAEIELVRQMLPEVRTVLLPEDPSRFAATIEGIDEFEKVVLLDEDHAKTERYRAERERQDTRARAGDLESYLRSLETRVTIRPAARPDFARLHQLFTKTNQFNLMTIRHGLGDVERFAASPDHVLLLAESEDRFGTLGTIGLALIESSGEDQRLDSFLLSCRAMGRGIETALMNRVKRSARERSPEGVLRGSYLPTRKNAPIARFLDEQGFVREHEEEDGAVWYVLELQEARAVPCDWLQVDDHE